MSPGKPKEPSHEPTCKDLNDLRREQFQLLRDLRFFQLTNRLERSAVYSVSAWYHYAIALAIILAESVANAYFFAQGNSLGLLGGAMQAFLISLVNVGVAIAVGKFWLPHMNHIEAPRRLVGFAAIPVHACFVVIFNLLAAHYRDMLSRDPDTALASTISGLLSQPFNLSFDSFMLFITGVVAAALGVWKGFTEDDPYPGYGALDRKYNKARQAFADLRRKLPDCPYDQPEAGEDS